MARSAKKLAFILLFCCWAASAVATPLPSRTLILIFASALSQVI